MLAVSPGHVYDLAVLVSDGRLPISQTKQHDARVGSTLASMLRSKSGFSGFPAGRKDILLLVPSAATNLEGLLFICLFFPSSLRGSKRRRPVPTNIRSS